MKNAIFILMILIVSPKTNGQDQQKIGPDEKTDWWDDVDGMLNKQAEISLGLADEALKQCPPAVEESLERRMALQLIDNVMHLEKAPLYPAVHDFLRMRIKNAIEEIRREKVESGAVIWKLYNHTFIVKTSSITVGFDIQGGVKTAQGYLLGKDLLGELVSACDVLFVSHFHADHADPWVASEFIKQDKPVVTPPGLWKDLAIYPSVVHPRREAWLVQKVGLPAKGIDLDYIAFPGHQGENVPNNVYLVFTPEGINVAHTGDQSNSDDFKWIDKTGDNYNTDVLMTNSWAVYPGQRLFRGFRPAMIIAGHENELGHTIDHREPYWLNYYRLPDKSEFPWIEMAWGEKFHYKGR
jgi:glyoxylase-like metal-dependent hydrolase (beta-lactamase superfamily II)